jgi:hypothetical protein
VEDALTVDWLDSPLPKPDPPHVIVPVSRMDRAAREAVTFARSISPNVTAVHVTDDAAEAAHLQRRWDQTGLDVPFVVIESPYRALIPPLLAYIDAADRQETGPIAVVLPEFVPRHFWEFLLHNQSAVRLKLHLFFRPNTVVIDVPYYLEHQRQRR